MINKDMKPGILKLILFFSVILTIPLTYAGAGIKYGVESINVEDEGQHCVQYGVYNPWAGNVTLALSTSGEIEQFASESKEIFVPEFTFHGNSINSEICFRPEVFARDCLIGSFLLCRKECPEAQRIFSGEVSVSEVIKPSTSGTGSSASAVASAPLTITVICKAYERNWLPVIALIIVIIITIAAILIVRQLRKPVTQAKKLARYKKMQERLKKMKKQIK